MTEHVGTTAMNSDGRAPPLVAHVIFRLQVGGLENGVVNLVNSMPSGDYRHVVICVTDYTEFRNRITRPDVEIHALRKPPGNGISTHVKLWQLLRRIQPDVVHTRNLAALEYQAAAALAGVSARVHSEHGRDMDDLDGRNWRHLAIRRVMRPFVKHYIALSKDLERYLLDTVGVERARLSQIYNGVDTDKFRPSGAVRSTLPAAGFAGPEDIVIGTVGRMEPVKDPINLARGFVELCGMIPEMRSRLRLVMIGEGSQREHVARVLDEAGLRSQAWLPGSCEGVAEIMRGLDIFVLPSLSEGISNTILEAMATGLAIVATNTGGNPELLAHGETGLLVPTADPGALATAVLDFVRQSDVRQRYGRNARAVAVERYSLSTMLARYSDIYRMLLSDRRSGTSSSASTGVSLQR